MKVIIIKLLLFQLFLLLLLYFWHEGKDPACQQVRKFVKNYYL